MKKIRSVVPVVLVSAAVSIGAVAIACGSYVAPPSAETGGAGNGNGPDGNPGADHRPTDPGNGNGPSANPGNGRGDRGGR